MYDIHVRARCTPTRLVSNLERGHTRRGGTQRQRGRGRRGWWRGWTKRRGRKREGKDRPVSGSLLDQLVWHKRPSFPSFSSPPLLTDLRARDHTDPTRRISSPLRRCVWPATIRVWNSNSTAQLSESLAALDGTIEGDWRDAWKRFILRVRALVRGLYRMERHRVTERRNLRRGRLQNVQIERWKLEFASWEGSEIEIWRVLRWQMQVINYATSP